MKKIVLGLFFLMGILAPSLAQDVHLSQFYTAQLNLNPALGGNYIGDYRISSNYRNQWREINDPITTTMIGVDKKFHFFSDEVDAGILFIQDQFSGFNLVTTKILISGAYRKQIGYNEFSGGIQFGMVLKSTDLANQTFPNQWVYGAGEFDPTVNNLELGLSESHSFMDVNFGLAWSRTYAKFKPTVGVSLFHLNTPKDAYSDQLTNNLKLRKVIHAEAVVKLKNNLSLEPKLLYMWTTKAQDAMIGANVSKAIKSSKIKRAYAGLLFRGGFNRNADAVIPVLGVDFKQVDVGISYDFNISELSKSSTNKSTFELSLVYTSPIFSPKSLSIPCDRY